MCAHVCQGHRIASPPQRGAGSRRWEEKCHCDLPRSLPSAGTVMLWGNCWPSMSVSGPLPLSVSQTRRRPYLEQLGWAGPAGRRARKESGHDGETSRSGLIRDTRAGAGWRAAGATGWPAGWVALDLLGSKSPGGGVSQFRVKAFVPQGGKYLVVQYLVFCAV